MLYLGNGMSAPVRIQGTFVTDEEIEDVIAHVRAQGEPEYFFKEEELIRRSDASEIQDDLFEEACRFIMSQGSASTSLLQRKFHIGYNRAARLMDLLEENGFISEQNGSKARSVLITEEDIESVFQ
jgi:S-DNA-T family DNA segregation ATPase FtsK/SpoIIIE